MEPILRWAGGKRQLLNDICAIINSVLTEKNKYYEPFIGGGSIAFSISHKKTIINDFNPELINVYKVVRDNPIELITALKEHQNNHCKEYYYKIRELDRMPNYLELSQIDKAARIIYLNKTCYNGLYRVNSKGYFNVPIGRNSTVPDVVMENKILELSKFLNSKNVEIRRGDFENCIVDAKKNDVIYFDPPYDYEDTNGFTSYNENGFSRNDLVRLKDLCIKLIKKGCKVIVSNNDTEFVNKIFANDYFIIKHIEAKRYINCDGQKRSHVKEVIIYGSLNLDDVDFMECKKEE